MRWSAEKCLACSTIKGELVPPGGVIYADEFWQVDHVLPPVFIPGMLVLKLKRHCEHLAALNAEEARTLGPIIQKVSQAVQQVTEAEKIHVASYGEGIRHVHFLITPRTADLPASNIRLTFWLLWRRSLYHLGWKRLAYDAAAIQVANKIRVVVTEFSATQPIPNSI